MIVICEECGKKYQIDPSKIKGSQTTIFCKACQHPLTVFKSSPKKNHTIHTENEPFRNNPAREAAPSENPEGKSSKKQVRPLASPSKNRFGLTEKAVSLMLLIALLPLFLYWGLSFKETSTRIKADSEALLYQAARSLTNRVDRWIEENSRSLKLIAELPAIVSMQAERQYAVMEPFIRTYPWIEGFVIADNEATLVSGKPDMPLSSLLQSGKMTSIVQATWYSTTNESDKSPRIILAQPIRNKKKKEGMVAVSLNPDGIAREIDAWKQGKMGYAFLANDEGRTIAISSASGLHPGSDLMSHPLVIAQMRGQDNILSFDAPTDIPVSGLSMKTSNGWILGIQAEDRELFKPLKESQLFAYGYLAGTMLLVVVIAVLAGRTMTKPIKQLTNAADRISVGELDVDIEISRKDELGDLAESLVKMQDSLRLSIERMKKRL